MTNFLNSLFITCDAPRPWGIYFQDSANPQMEALVELHDNIMFYLVIILSGVAWILVSIIRNYFYNKSPISNRYLIRIITIISNRLTWEVLFSSIITLAFAVITRKLYLHMFGDLPIRGELTMYDMSYLGILMAFRFLLGVFIEYCKGDIPLTGGLKSITSLSMTDNSQSSAGQSSSAQGSAGQSSSNVTQTNLANTLITPSTNDQVVLEKHGISLTGVFISNVKTKLYEGIVICGRENAMQTRRITFSLAIKAINENYPQHAFTESDVLKIKLLLKERGIYAGDRTYDKIKLTHVTACTKRWDKKNIDDLSW